ncbi:hypothetical protein GCM10010149_88600 [Nonomuraea roseoviolacea subsp. roseoviolacea]|uniref:hypothetical protein n=1 Tax=Nonomuraea roseoviolacea TaxID=103837 RepID=UPI0031D992CD
MVSVKTVGKTLVVEVPYHPDFAPKAKDIGGKWQGGDIYHFDPRDEERVRALLQETFGTDGAATELVDVRFNISKYVGFRRFDAIWLFGRQIVRRPGRDMRVQYGPGVVLVEGGFPGSGGSRANPDLDPKEGTVVEVRDIPAGHTDLGLACVEVIATATDDDAPVSDAEKLAAATEFVVNGYTIDRSAQVEGKWLLRKRDKDEVMFWGLDGAWINWRELSFEDVADHLRIAHELDDAFKAAKKLPEWKESRP